jgi:threonine dehydratase
LKCENFQRAGAFKFRGAYNALSQLDPAQRKAGVVAFSSGNHAQAVALAGSLLDVSTTIFMPLDAPATKLAATTGYGAKVVTYDRFTEDRAQLAADYAQKTGAVVVPPFDHPAIIAGQGTAALELVSDVPDLDLLLVPVGGGGLLAGSLLAVSEPSPKLASYGVEPAAANDTTLSFQARERITIAPPDTIADGLRPTSPGELTFPIIRRYAAGMLTVGEDAIADAVRFLALRLKTVVEPSGAVPVAALMQGLAPAGRRAGVIISGGNVDPETLAGLLA